MEADIEFYSEALGQASRDHSRRGRNDNLSKGVDTMTMNPFGLGILIDLSMYVCLVLSVMFAKAIF